MFVGPVLIHTHFTASSWALQRGTGRSLYVPHERVLSVSSGISQGTPPNLGASHPESPITYDSGPAKQQVQGV